MRRGEIAEQVIREVLETVEARGGGWLQLRQGFETCYFPIAALTDDHIFRGSEHLKFITLRLSSSSGIESSCPGSLFWRLEAFSS